jgi:hypothetical protein
MIRLAILLGVTTVLGLGMPGQAAPRGKGESAYHGLNSGLGGLPNGPESIELLAQKRPPAKEEWRFEVQYRSRKGPQFHWGPWRTYCVIRGSYNEKRPLADHVADAIASLSKNMQSQVLEQRVR